MASVMVSIILLFGMAHGYLVPTAFASNTDACDSPFLTDCFALCARLRDADNSTFQILHDTWTPINSYADCALSVLWPQNIGEGWLSPTYGIAADALDAMMEFGLDDDTISGVLARTTMGSDEQPLYWALTGAYTDNDSWQSRFEACKDQAQNSFTEAPGAVVDEPVSPDPASLNEFEAAMNGAQRLSRSIKSSVDKKDAIKPRDTSPRSTCHRVFMNFGLTFHYRCTCNNRQYDLFCDYISSAAATPWTEDARTAAILDLSLSVDHLWDSNTIQPGSVYSSNPLGAVLYTGASGETDRSHVPDKNGNDCCSYLIWEFCAPSHGPTGESDFVSEYGMCQPTFTHEYTYSLSKSFKEFPGGGPGPSNPKTSPKVGRLPGGL